MAYPGDGAGHLRLSQGKRHRRAALYRHRYASAFRAGIPTALEVLAANGVDVMIARDREYTPTPAISHAILQYNRGRRNGLADGIVVTPSHNPPEDGGFKYNPPHGGPADSQTARAIQNAANRYLDCR